MTLLLIIFFFLISFLLALFLHSPNTSKPNHGFKTYPILGGLPEFLANRHRFHDWTTDVIRSHPTHTAILFSPGRVGVMTALPENVEHILKTRFDNYPKGPRFASVLQDFLGSGIFNSDGDLWRIQRKTASFTFTHRNLTTFVFEAVRSEISTRLLPLLREASQSGQLIDLQGLKGDEPAHEGSQASLAENSKTSAQKKLDHSSMSYKRAELRLRKPSS